MAALREILADFGIKFPTEQAERADSTINRLVTSVARFASAAGVGLAINAIAQMSKKLIDQADTLRDHATALGLSVEELQAWNHAGSLNGVEDMSGVLQKFNRNVNAARDGSKQAGKAFRELGIDVKGALQDGGRPIDLLDQVAAGLQKVQDPAKRTAIVMDLFGRSGAKLLPLFSEGPEGLRKLRAEVAELGGGITNAFAEQADQINDDRARFDLAVTSIKRSIIEKLLPAFDWVLRAGIRVEKWFIQLSKSSKVVEAGLTAVAAGATALASVAIGPLGAAFAALAVSILGIIGVIGLLDDALVFLAGGDSLIGRSLDEAFGEGTQDKVRAFIGQVKEAVEAFKITQVDEFFEILRQNISRAGGKWQEWEDAIAETGQVLWSMLTGGWENFWSKLAALVQAGALLFQVAWNEVRTAGELAAASMSDAFDAVWDGVLSGAQTMVNGLGSILDRIPALPDWAAKGLHDLASDLESDKRGGGARDAARAAGITRSYALSKEAEGIQATLTAPAPNRSTTNNNNTSNTNNTTVNVTVPPGTPKDQADAVGRAARDGAQHGLTQTQLRNAHAGLVHREG